jgi:hypothetical protein
MKKLFFIGLATLAMGAATLTSCSKYEEGPSFTLSSKKSRVVGHWTLSSRTSSGVSTLVPGYSEVLHIEKDGSFKDTAYISYQGFNYSAPIDGTWAFSDDKLQLLLNSNTAVSSSNFSSGENALEIIKLSKNELKLQRTSGSSVTISIYTAQ